MTCYSFPPHSVGIYFVIDQCSSTLFSCISVSYCFPFICSISWCWELRLPTVTHLITGTKKWNHLCYYCWSFEKFYWKLCIYFDHIISHAPTPLRFSLPLYSPSFMFSPKKIGENNKKNPQKRNKQQTNKQKTEQTNQTTNIEKRTQTGNQTKPTKQKWSPFRVGHLLVGMGPSLEYVGISISFH